MAFSLTVTVSAIYGYLPTTKHIFTAVKYPLHLQLLLIQRSPLSPLSNMLWKRASTRTFIVLLHLLTYRAGAFASLSSRQASYRSRGPLVPSQSTQRVRVLTTTTESSGDVPRGGDLPRRIPDLPTLADYRKFALPCLALWIAGPLLSLVDTSFIGLSGSPDLSANNLAALGPATTFFDGATYLFAFLNVATTNLYASARSQSGPNSPEAESVVRTASRVAVNCGIGIMFFLLAFARPLLKLYMGDKAASTPGLLDAATDYVLIRALSMPTSLLLGVLQAALLGAKDSVTPLIAILYATVVNIFGDFILVNRLQMSLKGAAIATTLAQWASTAALIAPARRNLVKDHSLGLVRKPKPFPGGVTGRTFLAFAAPVLTLILGKLAAFGFMTNAAAGVPGQPTPLAAHQIILSLLFFCSPFLEVISQTAQTFLPSYLAPIFEHMDKLRKRNPDYKPEEDPAVEPWLNTSKLVATRLLGIGMVTAAVVASIVSLIPAFFGNLITSDLTVQQAVKPLAKYLWMGAFFWAPVAVCEGVLLARRELSFLASIYLVSTALLPPVLLRIKFRGGTVGQVWACFAIFQLFRAACFIGRIWGPGLVHRVLGRRQPLPATDRGS